MEDDKLVKAFEAQYGQPDLIIGKPEDEPDRWRNEVWQRSRGKCVNCGSEDKLRIRMIVPDAAGGKKVVENGVLLCRPCSMASDTASPHRSAPRRPVNFWVSRELHNRLTNGLKTRNGFTSMGAMVRYLMQKYVVDSGLFDDLYQYQDSRQAEVKINVWVDSDQYGTFKSRRSRR